MRFLPKLYQALQHVPKEKKLERELERLSKDKAKKRKRGKGKKS